MQDKGRKPNLVLYTLTILCMTCICTWEESDEEDPTPGWWNPACIFPSTQSALTDITLAGHIRGGHTGTSATMCGVKEGSATGFGLTSFQPFSSFLEVLLYFPHNGYTFFFLCSQNVVYEKDSMESCLQDSSFCTFLWSTRNELGPGLN